MTYFKRLIFLTTILATALASQAQEPLVPFSDLNGQAARHYVHSAPIAGGYVFYRSIPYDEAGRQDRTFYRVSKSGEITDSVSLPRDSFSYLISALLPMDHGGFVATGIQGLSFEFFNGENLNEVTSSQRRFIAEYDGDLEMLAFHTFDLFPAMENTLWGVKSNNGFPPYSSVYYPGTSWIVEDTLFSVQEYLLVTYDDSLNITDLRLRHQMEKLGLDGSDYGLGTPLGGIAVITACEFTGAHFFVFGNVGGPPPAPNSGVDGGNEIIQCDLTGQVIGGYGFDEYGSGFFTGSMAKFQDGKLFTTYTTQQAVPGLSCTDGRSVMVDIRDAATFEPLHPRFELPQCGIRPGCKRPFAVHQDGSFSYVAENLSSAVDTTLYLFRYSSERELLWQQGYILPGHTPIEIYPTEDGQLLLVCLVAAFPGAADVELRLYKVAPGGIISQVTSLGKAAPPPTFHPNPFTNELSLLAPPERPLRVDVFGMDGRAHGSYRAQEGRLQLGHLPGGAYVLRVSDAESGAFLGAQQVVKR